MGEPTGPIIVICGLDTDGKIRTLEVTADDFLKVAFTAAAQGLVGTHGWIGSAWQKDPILLGYSGRVAESVNATQSNGGNQDVSSTPVPSGEIHVISSISAYHGDPTSRAVGLYAIKSGVEAAQRYTASVAVWAVEVAVVELVLSEGDYITARCFSLADTKTVYLQIWGRRIDIDQ